MAISFEARKNNSRLTDYEELRDAVVANAIKARSVVQRRQPETNRCLFDF